MFLFSHRINSVLHHEFNSVFHQFVNYKQFYLTKTETNFRKKIKKLLMIKLNIKTIYMNLHSIIMIKTKNMYFHLIFHKLISIKFKKINFDSNFVDKSNIVL